MHERHKRANLIFKTGETLQVEVKTLDWPDVIEHKRVMPEVVQIIRFTRVGVQYGIGAYIETPLEGAV